MPEIITPVRALLLRLVAVLIVAVGIPVAIAGPAGAHHPEITAGAAVRVAAPASSTAAPVGPARTHEPGRQRLGAAVSGRTAAG